MKAENITVIPVKTAGGQFSQWRMSANNGPSKGPGDYPAVKVAYNDTADFTFTIVNPGNITFSNDPIWIQKGTGKPTGGVDSQITGISGQGTTVLKFHDTNQTKGTLTYVLNFNNAPQLDPIIENGGGGIGGGGFFEEYAAVLLGAAVLAVLAIWLIRRVMVKPDRPQGPGEG